MKINPADLKDRLGKASITKAVVIDDAFDQSQLMTLVQGTAEFWEILDEHEDWKIELQSRNISCDTLENFEVEGLSSLWNCRTEFSDDLGSKVTELFLTASEKLSHPEAVVANLKDLGFDVLPLSDLPPTDEHGDPMEGVQVVFLDYDLEGNETAVTLAERRSHAIAKSLGTRGGASPFVVLFSSLDSAKHLSEQFRSQAFYLKGSFLFLSKPAAADLETLTTSLATACVWCPSLGHFREFFVRMRERLDFVTENLKETLLSLNVQDYAHFQRTALQGDGAPLGEYMLDIFGDVLSHEFQNGPDLIKARSSLDRVDLTRLHLPFETQPTTPMQKIYRAVLTTPGIVAEFAQPHPRVNGTKWNNGKEQEERDYQERDYPPLLMLGDIFAAGKDKPVYVVMNSPCEMQYSDQKERSPKFDLSILLMEGELQSLDNLVSKPLFAERMRWLHYENHDFRVVWQPRSITAVKLADFDKWQRDNHYKRVSRLKVAYATSLKQFWLSSLGQIGLPVSPPIHCEYDLEAFLPSAGKWVARETCTQAGILSTHPAGASESVQFCLTTAGRDFVWRILSDAITTLDTNRKRDGGKLLDDSDFWWNLVSDFQSLGEKKSLGLCKACKPAGGSGPAILFHRGSVSEEQHKIFSEMQSLAIVIIFKKPCPAPPSADSECGEDVDAG